MSEPVQRNTVARRVGEIAQAGDTALGVAVSAATSATVRGGGLAAVAGPRGSAAVGVSDLEQRGERWWGRLARGVAAALPPDNVRRVSFNNSSATTLPPGFTSQNFPGWPAGVYGEVKLTNPWPVAANLVVAGFVDDWLVINGVRSSLVGDSRGYSGPFRFERRLDPGETLTLAVENRAPDAFSGRAVGSNPWFLRGEAVFTKSADALDWRPAARALVPVAAGLGWWGAIEAAARSGQWVRRASWVSGRRVRFEAGLGTSRAVARHELAGVVTTVDASTFGAAEFVAEDWLIEGSEIPLIDVTDVAFEGPVVFAISAAVEPPGGGGGGGGDDGNGGGNGGGVTFPATGEGVPYVRGGRVVSLLPVKDGGGAVWRP